MSNTVHPKECDRHTLTITIRLIVCHLPAYQILKIIVNVNHIYHDQDEMTDAQKEGKEERAWW